MANTLTLVARGPNPPFPNMQRTDAEPIEVRGHKVTDWYDDEDRLYERCDDGQSVKWYRLDN